MGESREISLAHFKGVGNPAFLESVKEDNKVKVNLVGFKSMHHPALYLIEVLLGLLLGSFLWWLITVIGINIPYILINVVSVLITVITMKTTYYLTATSKLIDENSTISWRVNEDFNKLKKVYLMPDNKVKFVYELIDLQNSNTSYLKYNIEEGARTLRKIKLEGDTALYNAVVQYKNTQVLTDKELLNLVNTYREILNYDEEKKKSNYFNTFVENKGLLQDQPYFKQLAAGNKVIVEDLEQLRLDGAGYLEENNKIISRVREEQLLGK